MFQKILDWSEVWALFIPLFFIFRYKLSSLQYIKPIKVYVVMALLLNIFIDVTMDFSGALKLPQWLRNNNPLYNIHSITRLLLFSLFFIYLKQRQFDFLKKIIPILFLFFVFINFIWFERFIFFSSRLHATESAILLFYSLQYYLYLLQDDQTSFKKEPSFWVATGLSIYVVINFFIFLFYKTLISESKEFAISIWDIHNISYIIFCIFLAKGFYESRN